MAKRWLLCPVIGAGTEDDPYRAKVQDYGVDHSAVIPSLPDGTPRFGWCLVHASANDFAAILADAQVDAFPDRLIDTRIGDLPAGVRNALRTRLEARGIDTSDVSGNVTLRQIIRRIGKLLDGNFGEDDTGVGG